MNKVKRPLVKSPAAIVRIGIDWLRLLETGDTVAASVWSCDDPSITFSRQLLTGSLAACRISGGEAGKSYKVYNTITTTSGDTDRRYIVVDIEEIQLTVE